MTDFPKIHKKLCAFLKDEDGRVPKETIVKIGKVMVVIGIGLITQPEVTAGNTHYNEWKLEDTYAHQNMLSLDMLQGCDSANITGSHSHNSQPDVDHLNRYSDSHGNGGWF
ncbi:hypothetical protein JW968_05445 [Candidatus Woesearchaeota archaeon]|nr:hypothetical protein [Candidatus Woesearchaeota archaeon]